MLNFKHLREFVQTFGIRGIFFRLKYLLSQRFVLPGRGIDLAQARLLRAHFPELDLPVFPALSAASLKIIRDLVAGKRRHFSRSVTNLGFPPSQVAAPLDNQWQATIQMHWRKALQNWDGDLKSAWEFARMREIWSLLLSPSPKAEREEVFWTLVQSWLDTNPPYNGVNWGCGQEASIRSLRVLIAAKYFRTWEQDEKRRDLLFRFLLAHGQRIAQTFDYARSQVNNHGISESVGLICIGLTFPNLAASPRWIKLGLSELDWLLPKLFRPDGLYRQYSINYQRFSTEMLIALCGIMLENKLNIPASVLDSLSRSHNFFCFMTDNGKHVPPNFGSNDGSRLFDFFDDDFRSYSALINTLTILLQGGTDISPSADPILGICNLRKAFHLPKSAIADQLFGGHFKLNVGPFVAFLKAYSHDSRPADADVLHVDLFKSNKELLFDPGSFTYVPRTTFKAFSNERAHNVCSVDGKFRHSAGPGFMWFDWTKSTVQTFRVTPSVQWALADAHLYPGVVSRRVLAQICDVIVIADFMKSATNETYRLNWNIADEDHSWLKVFPAGCPATVTIETSDESTFQGWRSDNYQQKEPCRRICATATGREARFFTAIGQDSVNEVRIEGLSLVYRNDWRMGFGQSGEFELTQI